jgi:hypothetical protein
LTHASDRITELLAAFFGESEKPLSDNPAEAPIKLLVDDLGFDAVLDAIIKAAGPKRGLDTVLDALIRAWGLGRVRNAVKQRRNRPGPRKHPWDAKPAVRDLIFYYAIESLRDSRTVVATCDHIARTRRIHVGAATLRRRHANGKRLLKSSDPDTRSLIETFERHNVAPLAVRFYFPKKMRENP